MKKNTFKAILFYLYYLFTSCKKGMVAVSDSYSSWVKVQKITDNVKINTFLDKNFNILNYVAIANGNFTTHLPLKMQ